MATLIPVEGETSEVQPVKGKYFRLDQLYELVGDPIDIVYLEDDTMLVIDDEAKVKGLPVNERATGLARGVISPFDVINGPVLHCPKGNIQ